MAQNPESKPMSRREALLGQQRNPYIITIDEYPLCRNMREGDVYRGPRGGLRTLHSWDPGDEEYSFPVSRRIMVILKGEKKINGYINIRRMERWLRMAALVSRGNGPGYPHSNCETCHGTAFVCTHQEESWRDSIYEPCPDCDGLKVRRKVDDDESSS